MQLAWHNWFKHLNSTRQMTPWPTRDQDTDTLGVRLGNHWYSEWDSSWQKLIWQTWRRKFANCCYCHDYHNAIWYKAMLQTVISWLWRKLLQVWSKKWCALTGLQGISFSLSHHCWSFTIVNHLYESDLVSSQGVRLELVSGSRVLCCGAGPGSGLQTLAGHKTTCFLLPLTIPLFQAHLSICQA